VSQKASQASAREEELVRRIRSRESAAEEELVRGFRPGLMAIARVRLGGDYAPDVVQETLATGLLNLRRGDWKAKGPLAAYLATILRRIIMRMHSIRTPSVSTHALAAIPATGISPLAAAERAQDRDRVRAALRKLPPRHHDVLVRHYFDGQSVEKIAREMGIPRGTVLSRLHHARLKMAKTMNRLRTRRHC
jgi:RNA polymerase sigma-70 factor (ECF subfamily)